MWLALGASAAATAKRAVAGQARQLWLYCPTNLLVNENVDKLDALWRRAAKVGYTYVLISDTKFCRLEDMPKEYFRNVERVKKLAAELKLELVPGVFPIGWSNGLLGHDPNLAEGLPVRNALFVVRNGEARLEADPPVNLPGTFKELKRFGYHDEFVVSDGDAVKIADANGRIARVISSVKVSPFRQYYISARIKTQDFHGTPEIKVIGGGRTLNYDELGVKPTQDWTVHHTLFNSLDNKEVNIYFGSWNGGTGTVWFSQPKLEEVGRRCTSSARSTLDRAVTATHKESRSSRGATSTTSPIRGSAIIRGPANTKSGTSRRRFTPSYPRGPGCACHLPPDDHLRRLGDDRALRAAHDGTAA